MKLIITTFVSLALLFGSAAAFSHSSNMSSMPRQGGIYAEPLETIQLMFGSPTRLIKLTLEQDNGNDITLDFTPSATPQNAFSLPMPPLSAGKYSLKWMVLGNDGHKMKGHVRFIQQ